MGTGLILTWKEGAKWLSLETLYDVALFHQPKAERILASATCEIKPLKSVFKENGKETRSRGAGITSPKWQRIYGLTVNSS